MRRYAFQLRTNTGMPGGMLSDLKGRRGATIAGWLVYAFAYLGFGAASQPWHIWALTGFCGLYFGLTEGGERALIADLVSPDHQVSAFGLFHFCIGIAALAGLSALLLLILLRPRSPQT